MELRNSENDLFNPNITFSIFFNKYITLINNFGLGRHLLRQDIVAGTDATLRCFKQNVFNIHIIMTMKILYLTIIYRLWSNNKMCL